MGQCRPLYQLSNQSRRPADAQQISRNLLPESLPAWLSPQHVALRPSPSKGGISAGSAGDCRIVNWRGTAWFIIAVGGRVVLAASYEAKAFGISGGSADAHQRHNTNIRL